MSLILLLRWYRIDSPEIHMDGLVQKRRYSVANALELRAETRSIIS